MSGKLPRRRLGESKKLSVDEHRGTMISPSSAQLVHGVGPAAVDPPYVFDDEPPELHVVRVADEMLAWRGESGLGHDVSPFLHRSAQRSKARAKIF